MVFFFKLSIGLTSEDLHHLVRMSPEHLLSSKSFLETLTFVKVDTFNQRFLDLVKLKAFIPKRNALEII